MKITNAPQVAHGPDHKIIDMKTFYSALVQALEAAHERGRTSR